MPADRRPAPETRRANSRKGPGGRRRALRLAVLAVLAAPGVAATQANAEAAAAGAAAYRTAGCAACHGPTLGGGFASALSGDGFRAKWGADGGEALVGYISTQMPPARPGGLPPRTYRDIAAFLLGENGLPSRIAGAPVRTAPQGEGRAAPPPPRQELAGPPRAASAFEDGVAARARAARAERLGRLDPVTQEMLAEPGPGDWLHFRRSYDSQGYSPLSAINRANVGSLEVAWSLSLEPGTNQIAPVVHDGVMFLHSNGVTYALDAADGEVLWTHVRRVPAPKAGRASQPRGLALTGTAVIVPTVDNHLLSLDVRTGNVNWDHAIGDADGLLLAAAPLVVKGKVIQGVSGCDGSSHPGGCFIVAVDAATGQEAWRFHTLQRPGSRSDSWAGSPLEARYGGSVWATGSYDPALDLVYFGAAQTYRIDHLMGPVKPPQTQDALYTNSTLALDPDTGRLAWHFQHIRREIWDIDWAFERQLADLNVGGRTRRVVMTMGKLGILDVLDARTGAYITSYDVGLQSLVTAIHPRTGEKTVPAKFYPPAGETVEICPYAGGVRNWPATSFDPRTGRLYVPALEACETFSWGPNRPWSASFSMRPRPDADGKYGRLEAIAVGEGKADWRVRRRAPPSSAVLATAGGLVFEGDRDRWFRASDSATGEVLWQKRLDSAPNAFPITYEAGGEQQVAVVTGGGGPLDAALRGLTPEIATPGPGITLWVFKRRPD